MEFKHLQFEIKEEIGILTLSRPEALNALNQDILEELKHFFSQLDTKKIRVLILKGAGEKAFVAGADIKEMLNLSPKEAQDFSKKGQDVFSLIEALPLPVIALIQGFALGGGLELALSCDILILSEKAKIGLPEVTLGLFPAFGGTQRLPRAVGFYQAKEMIFTGNFYTAQEALNRNLVNYVVVADKLMNKALELAQSIKKRSPNAIAQAKKLMQKGKDLSLSEGLKEEARCFGELFKTNNTKEGMKAFIEKRAPKFTSSK